MTPGLRAALTDALARRLDARRSVPDDVDAIAPIIDAAINDAQWRAWDDGRKAAMTLRTSERLWDELQPNPYYDYSKDESLFP